MKLTIDTQVDTHDDIRKVLQILTSILEKKDPSLYSSSASSSASTDTTNLMSMFSDAPASASKGTVETTGNAPDFSSFLNLTNQKKENKDQDEPKIEFY